MHKQAGGGYFVSWFSLSQEKVEDNINEMNQGKLKSGSGEKVTNPKQANAIGLSEARKSGARFLRKRPPKKQLRRKGNAY
ncbi:MAG: DUF6496 domain-containing protein [Ginsengibacter sp.]